MLRGGGGPGGGLINQGTTLLDPSTGGGLLYWFKVLLAFSEDLGTLALVGALEVKVQRGAAATDQVNGGLGSLDWVGGVAAVEVWPQVFS